MQHTFGLEIAEIGREELQGDCNSFVEVVHAELLPGAARWDISCHGADRFDSRNPCMDKKLTNLLKLYVRLERDR